MGADQREQGAEIAPLPDGNRQHKLGQLLGEWNDDSALAGRQPLLKIVPPCIVDRHRIRRAAASCQRPHNCFRLKRQILPPIQPPKRTYAKRTHYFARNELSRQCNPKRRPADSGVKAAALRNASFQPKLDFSAALLPDGYLDLIVCTGAGIQ